MRQDTTKLIPPPWQLISLLLFIALLMIKAGSDSDNGAYDKLALQRDSLLVSRIRTHARITLQQDLSGLKEVQVVEQHIKLLRRPSYRRYFHTTLQYKAMNRKGKQVLETQCFIYSKTGRLAETYKCD
jgi:hypothetical protein